MVRQRENKGGRNMKDERRRRGIRVVGTRKEKKGGRKYEGEGGRREDRIYGTDKGRGWLGRVG